MLIKNTLKEEVMHDTEDTPDSKNLMCEPRPNHRHHVRTHRCERHFATFRTSMAAVPFVEFTVVATTRRQAAQLARAAAKPLGLTRMEMD